MSYNNSHINQKWHKTQQDLGFESGPGPSSCVIPLSPIFLLLTLYNEDLK